MLDNVRLQPNTQNTFPVLEKKMDCIHYYKVNDCHTGDEICTQCGLIITA